MAKSHKVDFDLFGFMNLKKFYNYILDIFYKKIFIFNDETVVCLLIQPK